MVAGGEVTAIVYENVSVPTVSTLAGVTLMPPVPPGTTSTAAAPAGWIEKAVATARLAGTVPDTLARGSKVIGVSL